MPGIKLEVNQIQIIIEKFETNQASRHYEVPLIVLKFA